MTDFSVQPISELPKPQQATTKVTLSVPDRARRRAHLANTATPNLYVINLPAGDVGSINIDWYNNGAPQLHSNMWLSQGYDGVLFKGQGVDATHIRCTSWDGISVAILRHNGIVQFEDCTIHAGYNQAAHFGQQNLGRDYFPDFKIRLINVKGLVDQPFDYFTRNGRFRIANGGSGYAVNQELTVLGGTPITPAKLKVTAVNPGGAIANVQIVTVGSYTTAPAFVGSSVTGGSGTGFKIELGARPKWLWFGYNADIFMKNVYSDATNAVEHAHYFHGFARYGAVVLNCTVAGSGAEGFKVRSDSTETRWAGPNQFIYIADTTIKNWYQPWSWRGGAGLVLQGSGAHVVMERNMFFGGQALSGGGIYPDVPVNNRAFAIGISAEGVSYDQQSGAVDVGYGNGEIHLLQQACVGNSDQLWHNNLIRIAKNGGNQKAARRAVIDQCSLWGRNIFVSVGNIDPGTGVLQNSNTPSLKAFAESQGMDTTHEAVVPRSTLVPVSQGATW